MKSKRMERQKWIKNNLLMIPPWIWFVLKICLIAPFLWVTLDVVIACIEHKVSLEAFRAIEAALVKHINIMKDYSLVVWLITITANHSNYLVCDRANTQSVTVEMVKLQLNYCNALVIKWIYNIVLFGGKNAGCSFFITFNWCICSLFWR